MNAIIIAISLIAATSHVRPDHVITRDDIEAMQWKSVAEALRTAPGFYASYNYHQWDIGAGGYLGGFRGASSSVEFRVNGTKLRYTTRIPFSPGPSFIPMGSIERIEIYPIGAFSPRGDGGFFRVVNIVTKSVKPKAREMKVSGTYQRADGADAVGSVGLNGLFDLGGANLSLSGQIVNDHLRGLRLSCSNTASESESECNNNYLREPGDSVSRIGATAFSASLEFDVVELVQEVIFPEFEIYRFRDLGTFSIVYNRSQNKTSGPFVDWSSLESNFHSSQGEAVPSGGATLTNTVDTAMVQYKKSLSEDTFVFQTGWTYSESTTGGGATHIGTDGIQDASHDRFGASELSLDITVNPPLHDVIPYMDSASFESSTTYTYDFFRYSENPKGENAKTKGVSKVIASTLSAKLAAFDKRLALTGSYGVSDYIQLKSNGSDACGDSSLCTSHGSGGLLANLDLLRDQGKMDDGDSYILSSMYIGGSFTSQTSSPLPQYLFSSDVNGALTVKPNKDLEVQTTSIRGVVGGARLFGKSFFVEVGYSENSITGAINVSMDRATETLSVLQSDGKNTTRMVRVRTGVAIAPISVNASWSKTLASGSAAPMLVSGFPDQQLIIKGRANIDALKMFFAGDITYSGSREGSPLNLSSQSSYALDPYWLANISIGTTPLEVFHEKKTQLTMTVSNLTGTQYAFPAHQPLYTGDSPGIPRVVMFNLSQEL